MWSGCKTIYSAVGFGPKPVTLDWKTLVLRADDDANADSAVALDIVFVRDTAVLVTLAAMFADKWFAGRADIQRSFPDVLTVFSFGWCPGRPSRCRTSCGAMPTEGGLAFAGYASQGEHRSAWHLTPAVSSAIDY